jgi:hypothetical protein
VKAGPPLGVGSKVMTKVSSDVGPPGAVGKIGTARVRVDGVGARASTAAAGVACGGEDADA